MRRAAGGKQVSEPDKVPTSADEFRATLLERYDQLSKRLQQIARYVLDEPNAVALETLTVIAERCGVQPSAVVRFAQSFGFSGATQMQRLFRDGLISNNAALGYSERVRKFNESLNDEPEHHSLIGEFVRGNLLALQNLEQTVSESDMRTAVELIAKADTVFIVGFRRAFPVSSYLAYSLQQLGKKVLFIDGVAGLSRQQANTITSRDLLIAVSFKPYSQETVELVDIAVGNDAPVMSISDSMVSPIARAAALVLQVIEAEVRSFRSLATSICLAQALVIGFAFDSDKSAKPPRQHH
jgi:DNA-binding MurR/RpiR family transcriptional regulator